jgi:hypothetical protein
MVCSLLSFKRTLFFAAVALVSMVAREASAQIVMDGAMNYRMTRPAGASNWTTAATVSKITNYDYVDYNSVQAKLVLAKAPFVQGKSFKAYVVSSSNRTSIPARTYLTNLKLSGYTSLPKGKWRVTMVLVNARNQVLHGRTFPKTIGIRSAHRLATRSLSGDTLTGHAAAE